jgi:hypothetical protein
MALDRILELLKHAFGVTELARPDCQMSVVPEGVRACEIEVEGRDVRVTDGLPAARLNVVGSKGSCIGRYVCEGAPRSWVVDLPEYGARLVDQRLRIRESSREMTLGEFESRVANEIDCGHASPLLECVHHPWRGWDFRLKT